MSFHPTVQRPGYFLLCLREGQRFLALEDEQPRTLFAALAQAIEIPVLVEPVGLTHQPAHAVALHGQSQKTLGHGEGYLGGRIGR